MTSINNLQLILSKAIQKFWDINASAFFKSVFIQLVPGLHKVHFFFRNLSQDSPMWPRKTLFNLWCFIKIFHCLFSIINLAFNFRFFTSITVYLYSHFINLRASFSFCVLGQSDMKIGHVSPRAISNANQNSKWQFRCPVRASFYLFEAKKLSELAHR